MRRLSLLALLITLGVMSSACTEQIVVPNSVATITIEDAPSLDDGGVVITYTLADEEGDDQDLRVEICEGSEDNPTACGFPFEGPHSDGTFFVPTGPNGDALIHQFVWDVSCGRVNDEGLISTDVSTTYFARVSVRGEDDSARTSSSFSLTDLGMDDLPACSR